MSDDRVERALESLPDGGGPREGWQERVLVRATAPAERPRSLRRVLMPAIAGSLLVTAAAAFFVVSAMRTSTTSERRKAVERENLEALQRDLDRTIVDVQRLIREKDEVFQNLLAAQTEEEKQAAKVAMEAKQKEIDAKNQALTNLKNKAGDSSNVGGGSSVPAAKERVMAKCDPNDPLCGL